MDDLYPQYWYRTPDQTGCELTEVLCLLDTPGMPAMGHVVGHVVGAGDASLARLREQAYAVALRALTQSTTPTER